MAIFNDQARESERQGEVEILAATPFAVFWMRAHFLNAAPAELTEAASLDGAGPWRALTRIHLPLATPAVTSLVLLMFLSTWNTFLLALVLVNDPDKRTMSGALQPCEEGRGIVPAIAAHHERRTNWECVARI